MSHPNPDDVNIELAHLFDFRYQLDIKPQLNIILRIINNIKKNQRALELVD